MGIGGAQAMARVWAGGLTSPFTVLSYLGCPSMMTACANGRESRLWGWGRRHCTVTITALSLSLHYTVTALSPSLHCHRRGTVTVAALHRRGTATVAALSLHYTITALHHHCTITVTSAITARCPGSTPGSCELFHVDQKKSVNPVWDI